MVAALLTGCGGGESPCLEPPPRTFTSSQVAAFTLKEAATITDVELLSIGTDIKLMSNAALSGLQANTSNTPLWCTQHNAPITSITPAQIAALSPAQVRNLGSSITGVALLVSLNHDTFSQLTSDPAQVSAITVREFATLPSTNVPLFGVNLKHLAREVLTQMRSGAAFSDPAHLAGITADQIVTFSSAQLRVLGAGDTGIAQFNSLSNNTFIRLASDVAQVAAFTVPEVAALTSERFKLLAPNINALSNRVLQSLRAFGSVNDNSQLNVITPDQIATLAPAQVRLLGAAETGVAQLNSLNNFAFTRLVTDPAQVAAFTPAEIFDMKFEKFALIGANFNLLSNGALGAMHAYGTVNERPQIEAITPGQMATLTPAQVRYLGATPYGMAQLNQLSPLTFKKLVSDPAQVAAITPDEIQAFWGARIIEMDVNIQYLANATLAKLISRTAVNTDSASGHLHSLTPAQITVFSPAQIAILASIDSGFGIAHLYPPSFRMLSPQQIAVLTPGNVKYVGPDQLVLLSDASLAAFQPATRAVLTASQTVHLTPAQHSVCGC